ncbi:hypothetical protein F4824DRAFT_460566 [Ustulina deusta]|nr:hypothetical protein F4824DRAFT_460566 [Ustulina deusta]
MDLLYRAGGSKSYSFSSWIPEWTKEITCPTISTWDAIKGSFCAGIKTAPKATVISSALVARGLLVDVITSTDMIPMGDKSIASFADTMRKLKQLIQYVGD